MSEKKLVIDQLKLTYEGIFDLNGLYRMIDSWFYEKGYDRWELKNYEQVLPTGKDIEIEYVSPLAKAQKSSELQSIMRGIEIMGSLANVAPVFDYINFDKLVKHLTDIIGMPQKILKPMSQVKAERQQAQQQQAEQQQMQQMQQMAQAGGQIAPLAKALPEEAKALVNPEE